MKVIDINRVRQDTPGCANVLHFNNAGAALMPTQVVEAVTDYLQLESRIGGYEAVEYARQTIDKVYDSLSCLIGCSREEIAVIENATRAWDMAFYSLHFNPGDRILTAQSEYASNYIAFLQTARHSGLTIDIIPNDEYGQVSVDALEGMIDEKVKLIAITHVPTNGGLVNPAEAIGKVAGKAGIPYLLDACQSIGQMPIDVRKIGCDFLSATGRKYLRGPRGTGFLYVKRSLIEKLEPPFLDLHAAKWTSEDTFEIRNDARRFENYETNYAAKVGLGAAVDYTLDWGLDSIWARISGLADQLRLRLSEIPRVSIHDLGKTKCGIVTFTVKGITPSDIHRILAEQNINVSVSLAEYSRLDSSRRGLDNLVRASVHYYNTEDEVDRFCLSIQNLP